MNHVLAAVSLVSLLGIGAPLAALPVVAQPNPTGSTLEVTVEGFKNQQGNVCVTLFNQADAFPNQGAVRNQCVKISAEPMVVTIKDLPTGTYAAAIIHDANADGQMNSNFGIPAEGFGFSKNPPLGFAAPKFSECAFEVNSPNTAIQVKLMYLQ